MRYLLLLLLALPLVGADWTVNDPIKVSHEVVPLRGRLVLTVKIQFRDDAATPNLYTPIDYYDSGKGAWDRIREKARVDRLTLNEGELPPGNGITFAVTADPTSKEQAVLNANEARRKLRNLEAYRVESGKALTSTIGTSGITFLQALNSLISNAEADVTNAERLDVFVDETQ